MWLSFCDGDRYGLVSSCRSLSTLYLCNHHKIKVSHYDGKGFLGYCLQKANKSWILSLLDNLKSFLCHLLVLQLGRDILKKSRNPLIKYHGDSKYIFISKHYFWILINTRIDIYCYCYYALYARFWRGKCKLVAQTLLVRFLNQWVALLHSKCW